MSATVASGASVTQDRGNGFHLPTWIKPKQTHSSKRWWESNIFLVLSFSWALCTFGLCSRAVRITQSQQSHFYQLVKKQISLNQHKLCMFFDFLSFQVAVLVLHHTEHWQQTPWSDGHTLCDIARHLMWCIGNRGAKIDFSTIEKIYFLNFFRPCTSAVPALALWPHCGWFLSRAGDAGHRTPLPAPLLSWGPRFVLFQPSQLGRRGSGIYSWIAALWFLDSVTRGIHLWAHTDPKTKTFEN